MQLPIIKNAGNENDLDFLDNKFPNKIKQNKPQGTKSNWCEKYDDITDHVKDLVKNAHKRRALSGLRRQHNS